VARAGLLLALAVAAVLATSASAAAPRYILVSGPGLERPVVLSSWSENHALLISVANAPRAKRAHVRGLARRPRFHLAEFWGPPAERPPTRPSEANQHGWFYPAHRGRPAIVRLTVEGTMIPRIAPAKMLRILARHGVPARVAA
jgi:hypothetical protein